MVNSYMNKVGLTLSRTTNQIKIGEKIPVVFLSSFFRFDFFPKDPKPHPQVWLVTVLLQHEIIFYYKYFIVYLVILSLSYLVLNYFKQLF